MALTISPALNILISNTILGALDAGSGPAVVKIYDSGNVLLSELPLQDPCGSVNGGTGVLTLLIGVRDEAAAASGTASYATFCTSAGTEVFRLSIVAGTSPVPYTMVMPNPAIVVGAPVELTSVTIG